MGGSDSRSSQTTTDAKQDRSLGLQDVDSSSVSAVSGNNNTTYISSTDHDAVDNAYSFAGGAGSKALDAVDSAQNNAYSFAGGAGSKALDAVDSAQDNAYTFAGGAFDKTVDTLVKAGDAVKIVTEGTVDDVLTYTAGLNEAVLADNSASREAIMEANDRALKFSAGAFESANQAFLDAQEKTAEAYENSYDFMTGAQTNAFNAITDNVDKSYAFVAGAFDTATDDIRLANQANMENMQTVNENALNAVIESSTTESAKGVDTVVKFAGWSIAAIAAAATLSTVYGRK